MKYYHRNYFFLLTASALTTVLWSLTVSYTHLDVYKRQILPRTLFVSSNPVKLRIKDALNMLT